MTRSIVALPSDAICALLNHIPEISFFIKDLQRYFLAGNNEFLQIVKCSNLEAIIGKNDYDFFPLHIAKGYQDDDKTVMESGKPMVNIVELIPNNSGYLQWYATHKYPMLSPEGEVKGLVGISQKIGAAQLATIYPQPLSIALQYISEHYSEKISVESVAKRSHQSQRTLERLFKKILNMTVTGYIKQTRIHAVAHRIHHTSLSLSEIAQSCGFCDQSYMTKEFKKLLGVTPKAYASQKK